MAGKKVLIVHNPDAGMDQNPDWKENTSGMLEKEGYTFEFLELDKNNAGRTIKKSINDLKPSMVIAAGGDGTLNIVARQLLHTDIVLGIFPLGSANGMAYELGIPQEPKDVVRSLPAADVLDVDALLVNDKHLCFHMSDLGMNARVVKRYKEEGLGGLWGYTKHYFKELSNTVKFRCEVDTANRTRQSRVVMAVIANASAYGTGARVNPEGKVDDGRFEIVLVKAFPALFLWYMILSLFGIRKYDTEHIEVIRSTEAEIKVSPRQHLQVDGEHLGKQAKIRVKIIPGAIRMIAPGTD
jgi:YegS/Rv2252/BmrU family lipid kinase